MNYEITLANEEDIKPFLEIIIDRCKWFKENNINQWELSSYPVIYNLEYFKKQREINKLYVIKKNNIVYGGLLLKNSDTKYWSDSDIVKAYYIHHFATKIGFNGLGQLLLNFVINKCKLDNKKYLRLDCVSDNEKLNNYYKRIGFIFYKKITVNSYVANLYEMVI